MGALLAAVALLIVSLMGGHDAGSARSGSSKGSAAAAAAATADASAKAVASRHSALDAGPLLEGAPLAMHVYLMSRCPFGARLLRAASALLSLESGRRNTVAFESARALLTDLGYVSKESPPAGLQASIEAALGSVMDLSPKGIRTHLALNRPIYQRTSAYGHFGRKPDAEGGFSWERTDLVEALRKAV